MDRWTAVSSPCCHLVAIIRGSGRKGNSHFFCLPSSKDPQSLDAQRAAVASGLFLNKISKIFPPNFCFPGIPVPTYDTEGRDGREVPMAFTCHATSDPKALTAVARAVRKAIRAKTSRRVRLCAKIMIVLLLASLRLFWAHPVLTCYRQQTAPSEICRFQEALFVSEIRGGNRISNSIARAVCIFQLSASFTNTMQQKWPLRLFP